MVSGFVFAGLLFVSTGIIFREKTKFTKILPPAGGRLITGPVFIFAGSVLTWDGQGIKPVHKWKDIRVKNKDKNNNCILYRNGVIMKILVIFTGGTIGSTESSGYISPDRSKTYKLINIYKQRIKEEKRDITVEFETAVPYQSLSENITCENFRMLSKCLEEKSKNVYDGIIITHGTDTLQYTAAFIGYIMESSQVPVVIVSANYVLEDPRSNGADNFYYAAEFILQKKGAGAFVSYCNSGDYPRIHCATRIIMHQAYSDNVYSVCNLYYGYFNGRQFIYNGQYGNINGSCTHALLQKRKGCFKVADVKSLSGIMVIHPFPGMEYMLPGKNIKAVLHYTYHSGTICSISPGLRQFACYTRDNGIPVFVTGAGQGADYESVKCYNELGFHVLPVASPEAMYIKLWLCIINNKDTGSTIRIMQTSLADDIATPGKYRS